VGSPCATSATPPSIATPDRQGSDMDFSRFIAIARDVALIAFSIVYIIHVL
jgi:hypothetical protein